MLTIHVLQAVGCLMFFLLNPTAADAVISAKPGEIDVGLSDVLDINCSFSFDGTSNIAGLISLILSRANDTDQDFIDLASVSQFSSHVNLLTTEHITAKGFFNASNESFVSLQWEYPDKLQTGVYRCLAYAGDRFGRLITKKALEQVTWNQPTTDDWKNKVQEMIILQRNLEKRTSELEEQIRFSHTFIDRMTYNNSKYYISKRRVLSTTAAADTCEQFGGYLVEINDVEEYEALRSYLKLVPLFDGFFVAGTDEPQEGRWVFPSTNQPLPRLVSNDVTANGGRQQNCLVLWRAYSLKLGDIPCFYEAESVSFVCEIPQLQNTH